MFLSVQASAQYIGESAPPLPAPLRPGEVLSPANSLARALRTLAQSPRDFSALITAGRAALDLGDTQAAIGFFGRAEEVRPSDPAPKIGMGAATVVTGDASGALRWFFEAQRLGASVVALGADRGLAQDLLGNQGSAQVDYRAALVGREADEARRRLALSLGISGDRTGAFATLQPLIARRDPAVQRIRAFVLALVGDERGASGAIDQAMPGSGSRMAGFFRLLPSLSAPQKAAAVHLGIFPNPGEIRVASVSPGISATPPAWSQSRPVSQAPQRLPTAPRTAPSPSFSPPPRMAVADPLPRVTQSTPLLSAAPSPVVPVSTVAQSPVTLMPTASPVASVAVRDAPAPRPIETAPTTSTVISSTPAATTVPIATSAPTIIPVKGDRLLGIDRLLAQADELPVPPAPRPLFEKPKLAAVETKKAKEPDAKKADAKKVDAKKAEAKKAEAKKVDEAKKAADAKADREAIGIAGTNWVQLAGGSNADRMGLEFRRLAAQSAALKKRGGAVTAGKDYFRLLAGPFPSRDAAQAFVNQLAKDGVDGFSWTRTPATLKIEKLPPK
ncbi:MAG: SPOR domain-containing protein [Pseudomonadota bacterium]|nr:SPOR domain-containing protein [Pseudomonadota bacterium]